MNVKEEVSKVDKIEKLLGAVRVESSQDTAQGMERQRKEEEPMR